jgi:calcineurin-like phosphoesterase family protein
VLGAAGCGGDSEPATVWAVGDGAVAEPEDDRVGAFLAKQELDRFLYLGDVYETGTAEEYQRHYNPAFGRFKRQTEPVPGNHEWRNRERGYDRYWAEQLRRSKGRHYYSFDLAGWHFVALNSEEDIGRNSQQLAWLRDDLARRTGNCTIALVHRPRLNAGLHPDSKRIEPAWSVLEGRAVAVLSGDDHNYQRFEPERGIVQFVVGTGGRFRYVVDERDRRLASEDDDSFGALRLRLREGRAEYAYVRTDGEELDTGTLRCRGEE